MTLSGCFSSKNSDTRRWNNVSKATKSHFSSVKSKTWKIVKYFLLLGVQTLPSELLLYVYLLCCLSFTHIHTHTDTHTLYLSSPSRSQPRILICFTHLLHPTCCFFLGKSKQFLSSFKSFEMLWQSVIFSLSLFL